MPYSNTLLNLLWEWKDFNKPSSNPSSHYSFLEPWTFCWGSLLVYKRAKLFLLEILSYFFHWKLFFPGIPGSYVINHYLRNKHFDSNKHGEINSRNGDATRTINPKKANPATTWNKNSSLKIMIYIFQWLNCFLDNKSTTIFHCLYSYRPQKWCQNVQNSSGTRSCWRVVSQQSFKHFDVISMVDKGTDHLKLLSICFLP